MNSLSQLLCAEHTLDAVVVSKIEPVNVREKSSRTTFEADHRNLYNALALLSSRVRTNHNVTRMRQIFVLQRNN